MPKTLLQSVVSQLHKERARLDDELHRVTAALTAFGQSYFRGSKSKLTGPTRKKHFSCGTRENRSRAKGAVGKDQGAKGGFKQCPQRTHIVRSRPQKNCQSSESSLGKVAQGAKESLARLPINYAHRRRLLAKWGCFASYDGLCGCYAGSPWQQRWR